MELNLLLDLSELAIAHLAAVIVVTRFLILETPIEIELNPPQAWSGCWEGFMIASGYLRSPRMHTAEGKSALRRK